MSTPAAKKPPSTATAAARDTNPASSSTSSPSHTRTASVRSSATPTHARTRSLRTNTPVTARNALTRRDSGMSQTGAAKDGGGSAAASAADADARAETASALSDLQQRLEKEEKAGEQSRKQIDVLQAKLDDAVKESGRLEEKSHEFEEQIEALKNEKREATRQIREMESIYESEKSAILKEKEEMANREEEMQSVIQRLKDSLAQRNNDDEPRPSRTGNASPSLSEAGFAPPSSLQRSDSRNSSKLVMQKDKLIESLRLELAEAQIKLVESENQGGGRLQEVERLLMEARMANARLMEDNESYQLLLQEKTLKGDFGQSDFSYMGTQSNSDALAALEGKGAAAATGSSLADELSELDADGGEKDIPAPAAAAATETGGDRDRRLESELKSMKEQNKALTLYINKIIERLLQHQDFEQILDTSTELGAIPNTNKDLPPPPAENGQSLLQRAKSVAMGGGAGRMKPRPMSFMPSSSNTNSMNASAHTDPDTAPSIPIGNPNLTRSTSTRRSRPQSEQFTGAASLVSQMYKGPDGPVSPSLTSHNPRHSSFFAPSIANTATSTSASSIRTASGSHQPAATSGNFPGMRSETSSISEGDVSTSLSTPPNQSPPRSEGGRDKPGRSFAGGKPKPLRLVQENPDAVKENKRGSWYTGWAAGWGGKKEEGGAPGQGQGQQQSIPE